uniref:C-type lectin domain-containing protein n=1 Tax=Xiphophorus maculatus TaxID=8083 RepID=A0A3B5PRG5_XIPMA
VNIQSLCGGAADTLDALDPFDVSEAQNAPGLFCNICPLGWTWFQDRCYLFVDAELDWAEAEQYCISHGGNLASIHCQEEYAFIRNFIFHVAGNSRRTWVGGYDGIEVRIWQWSDGSRNDFSMWGPRGPNNCDTENCMEINVNGVEIKLLCIWLHTQNSLIKFTTLHSFN